MFFQLVKGGLFERIVDSSAPPVSAVPLSGSVIVPLINFNTARVSNAGEDVFSNPSNAETSNGVESIGSAQTDWGTGAFGVPIYSIGLLYGEIDRAFVSASIPVSSEIVGFRPIIKISDNIGSYSFGNEFALTDGSNNIIFGIVSGVNWPASSSTFIYGTSSTTFNQTRSILTTQVRRLGITAINGSPFNMNVDYIGLELFYDEPLPPVPSTARSTGFTAPTSAVFAPSFNSDWINPTNIFTNNNVYATTTPTGLRGSSDQLLAKNFNFSIPSNATITGFEVRVNRFRSGGTTGNIRDTTVRIGLTSLFFGDWQDISTGTNKTINTNWSTTETQVSYGSAQDSWGQSFTPANVNDPNFAFALAVENPDFNSGNRVANVDLVEMNVHYLEPDI